MTDRLVEAFALAEVLHRAQRREGSGTPYIAHLMGVASIALEHGAEEDEAIAALLHDAVEDQGGIPTLERIRAQFGEGVAAIVAACTDSTAEPRPPWRARKEAYLAKLAGAPRSVKLVSASDKLYNARSIVLDHRTAGEAIWTRFSGGRDGVRWYYGELPIALRGGPEALVEELARTCAQVVALGAT